MLIYTYSFFNVFYILFYKCRYKIINKSLLSFSITSFSSFPLWGIFLVSSTFPRFSWLFLFSWFSGLSLLSRFRFLTFSSFLSFSLLSRSSFFSFSFITTFISTSSSWSSCLFLLWISSFNLKIIAQSISELFSISCFKHIKSFGINSNFVKSNLRFLWNPVQSSLSFFLLYFKRYSFNWALLNSFN